MDRTYVGSVFCGNAWTELRSKEMMISVAIKHNTLFTLLACKCVYLVSIMFIVELQKIIIYFFNK